MRKIVFFLSLTVILIFAVIGLGLTAIFASTYFHLTDVKGKVDIASTLFTPNITNQSDNTLGVSTINSTTPLHELLTYKLRDICYINNIASFGGDNATKIYNSYLQINSDDLVKQMVNAVTIRLKDNPEYNNNLQGCDQANNIKLSDTYNPQQDQLNLFPWVNDKETYKVLTQALTKDISQINKAASLVSISPRLLVSPLFVEQWREFTTQRELFKKLFRPLMTLATSTNFSMGVMNIKEDTAIQIESNLKNPESPYYLGSQYEHLLDFNTTDPTKERFTRLANYSDHSYSYLYGAVYLAELIQQWKKMGYPIDSRPEIIATLFNIGFSHSKPNPNPSVGGAEVDINGIQYTFGGLAYEFYYSGELTDLFPYSH